MTVHHAMESPSDFEGLVVWVRDGFQESENAVIQDIQRRSVDDASSARVPRTPRKEQARDFYGGRGSAVVGPWCDRPARGDATGAVIGLNGRTAMNPNRTYLILTATIFAIVSPQ